MFPSSSITTNRTQISNHAGPIASAVQHVAKVRNHSRIHVTVAAVTLPIH